MTNTRASAEEMFFHAINATFSRFGPSMSEMIWGSWERRTGTRRNHVMDHIADFRVFLRKFFGEGAVTIVMMTLQQFDTSMTDETLYLTDRILAMQVEEMRGLLQSPLEAPVQVPAE